MLTNCFRFAPRDSVPGLIAKICKYLKDHPGWSAEELEEFITNLLGQSLVTSFNGRTGEIILTKDDVNDLYIAATYFAEDGETINTIDCTILYKNGIRIVCTNYDETSGTYLLTYLLEYYKSTDTVQAYPISGGGGAGGVISVNGRTGVVNLSLADVLDAGQQIKLCTATEFTATTSETWTAYYNDGYRIVCVVNDSATAVDYLYVLKQDENNHNPIMIQTSADAPVDSVNGKKGVVTLKVVDVVDGESSDENAFIFVDESDDYPSNITANNSLALGGNPPSYYLPALGIATDSAMLGGKAPDYYATAESVTSLSRKTVEYAMFQITDVEIPKGNGFIDISFLSDQLTWLNEKRAENKKIIIVNIVAFSTDSIILQTNTPIVSSDTTFVRIKYYNPHDASRNVQIRLMLVVVDSYTLVSN